MPHVTFMRFKALPGRRQAVINQFEKWERSAGTTAITTSRTQTGQSRTPGSVSCGRTWSPIRYGLTARWSAS